MRKPLVYTRPTFGQALAAWKTLLQERGYPTDCLWLYEENLCFEGGNSPGELKLRYQTRLTPPPERAEELAYRYFADFEAPIVFYRIGSSGNKSLCVLLCDKWFMNKGEAEGFIRKDDWLIAFRPGTDEQVEEITEPERWKMRVVKQRPLHDVDFSMTLRAVHETLAHGRQLTTYEHYALRFLHGLKEFSTAKK